MTLLRSGRTISSDQSLPSSGQRLVSSDHSRFTHAHSHENPRRGRSANGSASHRTKHPSKGFTLVELLVVMLIISIVSSAVLFGMMGAAISGKKARTRSQIERLHKLITDKWDLYIDRPVPMRVPPNARNNRTSIAGARLNAIRDLMRMELPDRRSDVTNGPTTNPITQQKLAQPAVHAAYQRRAASANWSAKYQGAECLYMIIAETRVGTRSGLEFFQESEIGDVDEDGMPEILDGFGNPIKFLRWAPGFDANSPLQPQDPDENPDPFDPTGFHETAYGEKTFGLVPVIFSAGIDEKYAIDADVSGGGGGGGSSVDYTATTPPNNPYATFGGNPLGRALGDSPDDITNHFRN